MTVKQIVDMGCAYSGISAAELARRVGWTSQNLRQRLKTGKLSIDEWEAIANALGAELSLGFLFPDGKKI